MKVFKNYREESKLQWGNDFEEGKTLNLDQINTGCMLRIADATEVMAKNYTQMQADLEMYERWWKQEKERVKKLEHRNRALKGQITKLKKKLSNH